MMHSLQTIEYAGCHTTWYIFRLCLGKRISRRFMVEIFRVLIIYFFSFEDLPPNVVLSFDFFFFFCRFSLQVFVHLKIEKKREASFSVFNS